MAQKKKKRKKRKQRKREPDAVESPEAESEAESEPKSEKPPHKRADKSKYGKYIWLAIALIGITELYMFGRRGHIEVCVAQQGVHDWALLGQKRNDENTRRYPTCEKRLNIGIDSQYDKALEQSMLHACRRANILRGKQAILICAVKEAGWEHRVTETQCPPWHDHYYKRLFWFAF